MSKHTGEPADPLRDPSDDEPLTAAEDQDFPMPPPGHRPPTEHKPSSV